MKSWKRAVTVALCAAGLLAGCGGDCGLSDDDSADEPQITVELRTISARCSKSTTR